MLSVKLCAVFNSGRETGYGLELMQVFHSVTIEQWTLQHRVDTSDSNPQFSLASFILRNTRQFPTKKNNFEMGRQLKNHLRLNTTKFGFNKIIQQPILQEYSCTCFRVPSPLTLFSTLYSPDLSMCDFFLWGYLKSRVYVHKPRAIRNLRFNLLISKH